MISIRFIKAAETRPLRQKILRPHQRAEELVYPGDDAPETMHLGAFREKELVGVASLYLEPPGPLGTCVPPGGHCWRLRGMAVLPELQGSGVGGQLLKACVAHIKENDGSYLWCNARVTARKFYERHGFVARGEVFELPAIGPHVFMEKSL